LRVRRPAGFPELVFFGTLVVLLWKGRITQAFSKVFETSGTPMGGTSSSNIAFPMKFRSDFGAWSPSW
jgi:hypothetical protein